MADMNFCFGTVFHQGQMRSLFMFIMLHSTSGMWWQQLESCR